MRKTGNAEQVLGAPGTHNIPEAHGALFFELKMSVVM
jgi:hypothetical protein